MKDTGRITRREFIAATAAVGACICGLEGCILFPAEGNTPRIHPPAYKIAESKTKREIIIDAGKVPDLLNEGSAVKIIDERLKHSIIIANTGENAFTALSIACTHNQFEVEYKHEQKLFKCISINHAEFSTDGRVIRGPTREALTSYPIRRQNDQLILSIAG